MKQNSLGRPTNWCVVIPTTESAALVLTRLQRKTELALQRSSDRAIALLFLCENLTESVRDALNLSFGVKLMDRPIDLDVSEDDRSFDWRIFDLRWGRSEGLCGRTAVPHRRRSDESCYSRRGPASSGEDVPRPGEGSSTFTQIFRTFLLFLLCSSDRLLLDLQGSVKIVQEVQRLLEQGKSVTVGVVGRYKLLSGLDIA